MPCLINSQTLKMISQVESFLYTETPEEGQRIQRLKHVVLKYHTKDEDSSLKNQNKNNTFPILLNHFFKDFICPVGWGCRIH